MRTALALSLSIAMSGGACAHGEADRRPLPVRVEVSGAPTVFDARALVERAVRLRLAGHRDLVVVVDPDAALLAVRIESVSNDRFPGSDPRIRAPRYRVSVRLSGEVRWPDGGAVTARADGDHPYVARAGGIERLDGAYRTFLPRAAERAAEQLVDILGWRARRFTSRTP